MRKTFKSKNVKKKHYTSKLILAVIILYIIYQLAMYVLIDIKLVSGNEAFLKALLNDSNHHLLYEKKKNNLINKITVFLTSIDFSKPLTIINKSLNNSLSGNKNSVNNESEVINVVDNVDNYIKDPNPQNIEKPRVYLYNTHQGETYSNEGLEAHNITPNVIMASYLLKEKLNNLNIPTIAEEANLLEFIRINNWTHDDSYKASRVFILDTINKYENLDLIIDVHRDAVSKEASTVNINGKNYAKVLFVVGVSHDNYKSNLDLSNRINDIIKQKYPGLSRGVMTKGSPSAKAIYNQDLNPKMILLEVGGNNNTIDEVLNTIEAMSQVIKEFLS